MDSWNEIGCLATTCTSTENFLKATSILIEKPHVVNRNLCGATLLVREKLFKLSSSLPDLIQRLMQFRSQNATELRSGEFSSSSCDRLSEKLLQELSFDDTCSSDGSNQVEWKMTIRLVLPKNPQKFRKLIELVLSSAVGSVVFFPLVAIGEDTTEVSDDQAFSISHAVCAAKDEENNTRTATLSMQAEMSKAHLHHSEKWLSDVLLPKLVKWSEEDNLHLGSSSIALVSLERYNQVYQEMKEKYGKRLVEIWPERTDPLKFVYEEVAIASYLLVLFEEERRLKNFDRRQSFVDLGCGNGLLVYVLANEGHPGKGIDVRKRNIWDMYGPEVILEEGSITPSDETLFKDSDWLIGNHSDELTPWIPVIAARSSYNCSYFVLPCCAHDFNAKFSERRPGCSQYQSYLGYVREVGAKCGFKVQQDMLRIPSTKRTCFIGCKRTYPVEDEAKIDKERTAFINERCARVGSQRASTSSNQKSSHGVRDGTNTEVTESRHSDDSTEVMGVCKCETDSDCLPKSSPSEDKGTTSVTVTAVCDKCNKDSIEPRKRKCSNSLEQDGKPDKQICIQSDASSRDCASDGSSDCERLSRTSWVPNFKPREQVEKVRNCTGVSKDLQERIVNEVFQAVLKADDASSVVTPDQRNWNRGGSVPLGEVAKMFDKSSLGQLKNECGGLQTLLRNKHQIFMVVGGKVYLRHEDGSTPVRKERKAQKDNAAYTKTKLCWFFEYHPDGCPKDTKDCLFAHGKEDLQMSSKD
ncbi:probable tRNA (uracil-O(2)-)-methyltransferase isoform X2 [Lineus longissimus]|uniref:probable tRNA (uracil-O(2)-)-methyltransferase isoform X2 n=1 Tax=Lineus longissimus TaxID=88925 RepID=UPI00315CB8AE